MKSLWVRLALACAFFLSACGPIYETVYDYAPPASPEGRICAAQCTPTSSLCRENCDLREQRCVSEARERGARDYERYVRQRQRNDEPIKKSVSDFTYDGGCYTSSSCRSDCTISYNQCFTVCGGTVTSRRVCSAFCK
jgi:hypothetical protein